MIMTDTKEEYNIPEEYAEAAKSLVGQTLCTHGKKLMVLRWESQNYLIKDLATLQQGVYPVMVILDRIRQGHIIVADAKK